MAAPSAGGGVGIFWIFVGCVLLQTADAGELLVLHSPNYVHFLPNADAIKSTEIAPMIAASFGLPLDRDLKWNGLEEVTLFRRPKASAVISVTGIAEGQLSVPHVASYKAVEEESNLNTEELVEHIEHMDWKVDPLLVEVASDGDMFNIRSRHADAFAAIPTTLGSLQDDISTGTAAQWFTTAELGSLNVTLEPDLQFAGELYVVKEVIRALLENKNVVTTRSPDFFHFRISGLERLAMVYGRNSVQFRDALRLLKDVIAQVNSDLQKLYGKDVVVQLVTFTPEASLKPSSRRGRNLLGKTPSADPQNPLNLAPAFSNMYAAMFNIALWSMIVFGLAIFFVSWGIWNMDPGRDSIIYRMTSQRTKRD